MKALKACFEKALSQITCKNACADTQGRIREACDFDGILFVDASLQDVDVDQLGRTSEEICPKKSTSRAEGHCANEHPSNGHLSTVRGSATSSGPRPGTQSPACDLVGYSLGRPSRRSTCLPSSTQTDISQSTLGCLLRRYSHGKVFYFDENGHLLPTETIENETLESGPLSINAWKHVKFEREKEQLRAYQLLDVCPGARSIAFFPLWDPHQDRVGLMPILLRPNFADQRTKWYAGSLAWSISPTRILQSEELTFLGAFGSCIMAVWTLFHCPQTLGTLSPPLPAPLLSLRAENILIPTVGKGKD